MFYHGRIREILNLKMDELVAVRRHLHRNPELSFQEKMTSDYLAGLLEGWGITCRRGLAGHGITGFLGGKGAGSGFVALRADMDALPIPEETGLEFASVNPGIMHACGHDVHMVCLLGALWVLKSMDEEWGGRIQFIFQPGEEKLPGGASLMIKEGLFDRGLPDVIIGQHVQPGMEVGRVGLCPGKAMASCDEIYVSVQGRGGHAAMPHLSANPIGAGAMLVQRFNDLLPGLNDLNVPAILSIGKFNTVGGATNIIPEIVHLEGTFRCMDEGLRENVLTALQKIAGDISKETGTRVHLNIAKGYPCLHNDVKASSAFFETAKGYLGSDKVAELPPRMTSEDFSYYSQLIPAVFYRLGTGDSSNVHTAQFTVNEESIHFGSGLMACLALRFVQYT